VCLLLLARIFAAPHRHHLGIKLTAEAMEIAIFRVYAFWRSARPGAKIVVGYTKLKRAAAATERVFEMMSWQRCSSRRRAADAAAACAVIIFKKSRSSTHRPPTHRPPPALNDVN